MTPPDAPQMLPYRHHLFVCTGSFCSPDGAGRRLYQELPSLLARYGLLFGADRTKRGETPCLGVCQQGPIVALYPPGLWYHSVTLDLLERIVREGIVEGKRVEEHLFHELPSE